MKIELTKDEMKLIEKLLMDAALTTNNYNIQGDFRELKNYFYKTYSDHVKYTNMKLGRT